MISSIIKNKIIETPWPVYVDEKLINGSKFGVFESCHEECLKSKSTSDSNICEHGLSHVTRKVSGAKVTVSGVYILSGQSSKKYKKNATFMQRKTSKDSISEWFTDLDCKTRVIQSLVAKTAKSNFDQFHEFVKWAREIGHYSERLLGKNSTSPNKIDAFDNASEDLKSLYKTSVMLLDSLDTTALYFNPESAKFGRKKSTDIYSLVHKIKLVLSHSTVNKGRVNVAIKGRVDNKHKVYESFKIIPLSLIQNAIKYKKTGEIDVVFEENGDKLIMKVNSIGHEIEKDERDKLFIRGFRTQKAREMSVEGSGLGLYVLKIVADAHNFDVLVTSTPILPANKKLAKNSFIVSIH